MNLMVNTLRAHILLSLILSLGPQVAWSSTAQITARSGVNFRASPNGAKLGALAAGTQFDVISQKNNWLKVRLSNGSVGYIYQPAGVKYNSAPLPSPVSRPAEKTAEVDVPTPSAAPGPVATPLPTLVPGHSDNDTNQLVTTARVNVRTGPGTQYQPLGLVAFGHGIDPTGREKNGWVEVEVAGRKGWVHEKYLTEGRICPDGTCGAGAAPEPAAKGFVPWARQLTDALTGGNTAGGSGKLSYADLIQSKVSRGYAAGKNKCWRAVWEVLKAAGLVKGELTQNSAKNALVDLQKFGFRHDSSACNRPGVVRVYGSTTVAVPSRSRTAGDTHGHIEILGTDGRYHHFTKSINSIQARFGKDRRPLKYCLVKG